MCLHRRGFLSQLCRIRLDGQLSAPGKAHHVTHDQTSKFDGLEDRGSIRPSAPAASTPPAAPADRADVPDDLDAGESSDSTTGWTSSEDEEDDDDDEPDDEASTAGEAQAARAAEQLKVLEAAGLLVKSDQQQEGAGSRARDTHNVLYRRKTARRSDRTKGPRPQAPVRRKKSRDQTHPSDDGQKPEAESLRRKPPPRPTGAPPSLPSITLPAPEPERQTEDAYDRFMKLQSEVRERGGLTSDSIPGASHRPSSALSDDSDRGGPSAGPVPEQGGEHSSDSVPAQSSYPATGKTSGFLSSITSSLRGKAHPSSAQGRLTPVISGPISGPALMTQPDSSGKISPSPAADSIASAPLATSTWSSFVDAGSLQSLPDRERRRQEAIFELCQTEQTHVRDLQTIVQTFFSAIQEQSLLDEKARMVIFANVEDVLITAVSFLSDLEERQRASRLYIDHIGDILLKHLPRMTIYLPYCTNQAAAARILSTERSRNTQLEALLQRLRSSPEGRGLDLSSYLLTPMQRITRYPLLLNQILKYTDEDHVDYDVIRKGTRIAEKILGDTNERIREEEGRERLKMLSQTLFVGAEARVDLTRPTRHLGPRKILKEEVLSKRKSKSGRKLTLVLCNDILLILSGSDLYRMPSPLEEVVVREKKSRASVISAGVDAAGGSITSGGEEGSFQIVLGGTDKVDLKTSSVRTAHLWMRAIEEARSECLAEAIKVPHDSSSVPQSPPSAMRPASVAAGPRRPLTPKGSQGLGSAHSGHRRQRSSVSQQPPLSVTSPRRALFHPTNA
ncbi:unnamed protein product [Parajaminaea phylloscopi]